MGRLGLDTFNSDMLTIPASLFFHQKPLIKIYGTFRVEQFQLSHVDDSSKPFPPPTLAYPQSRGFVFGIVVIAAVVQVDLLQ